MTQESYRQSAVQRSTVSTEPEIPKEGRWRFYLGDYLFLFALAGSVIALDQWTKGIIRANLELGQIWVPFPEVPFLRIVHWHNTGAAFGIFQRFGSVFTVLGVIVALAIIYYFPRVPREDWALRLAMSLQLGGAVGNLTDRLLIGMVTDFVQVGNFPVFNVADASISIGVAVLVISVWFKDHPPPAQPDSGELPTVPEGGRSDPNRAGFLDEVSQPASGVSGGALPEDPVSEEPEGG